MAMPRDTYVWKITDSEIIQQMKSAKNSIKFESDIFKMHKLKWFLRVYPNGRKERYKGTVKLSLCLAAVPSHLSKLSVRYKMTFVEGDEISSGTNTFHSGDIFGTPDWFNTNKLLKFNTFTFEISIQIIQLYDANGKEIEDETERKVENIGSDDYSFMGVRIDSLETRMNEMVKNLRNKAEDDEKRDIILLKGNMNENNNNNKVMLSKKDELKKWLTDAVGLPSYYNVFVENGIEDLEVAKLITMETLKEMQISKIGHKMKIMQKVAALNANVEGINVFDTNQQ